MSIRLFVLLAFFIATIGAESSIDREIEKIKDAPIKTRYKLMNQLKEKLAKMRQKERLEAIKRLQKLSNAPAKKPNSQPVKEANKTVRKSLGFEEIIQERVESDSRGYLIDSSPLPLHEKDGHE